MDNVYLKNLASGNLQNIVPSDKNAPLSFLQWKEQSPTIPEQDETYHYNQYVLDWFSKNKNKTVSSQFVLRQKYLYLLQQLQMFFTEEEKATWYNQINFAEEKELLTAIPYFARKLRDIAIYYLSLRKQLKNTKLKYNTVGTTKALEHEIYSYLLNALSPDNNEYTPELLTLIPLFSATQQSLVVEVDEMYDDNQYFDWSPTAPLSGYVNILDAATASFFQTKGISLSSDSWIFNTFNLPVTGDLNTLVDRLTGNVFETTDVNLYGNFIQNYLAENKYTLTYTNPPSSVSVTSIPLSAGNNRFYYPYGLVDPTLTISGQLQPLSLSSIQLSGAASGTTINTSDSIFVKYGNDIKGAWYRYIEYGERDEVMDAHIEHNATTTFIYPYAGYGLSAEDMSWTGANLDYDPQYPFLSKDLKAGIQQAYWSAPLSSDSCVDIYLNNTTAVSAGANASDIFHKADKIYLRDRNMVYDTKLPVRELSGAWLYKFTETALPISPIQPNVILWPYDVIDTTLVDLPEHLQNLDFQGVCKPIPLSDLNTSYFVAATSINLADSIYKLRYFTDNEQTNALECAWLSGSLDTVGLHTFVKQDGLTLSLSAGQITRFVWTGSDNTPLSSVFTAINHQADCPFTTNTPSVSAYEWQKCTCKQVYYSPLGHSGYQFTDNNSLADFIVEDTAIDFSNFNINTWTDLSGNGVLESPLFAWYNTHNKNSWGDGLWTSLQAVDESYFGIEATEGEYTVATPTSADNLDKIPNPNTLKLKYGHSYFYGRANTKLNSTDFPPYNVLASFGTNNTVWVNANPNSNKTAWESDNTISLMQLNAGDYFKIVRQNQTTSYYLSSYRITNTSSNQGSVWATYDSIALNSNTLLNSTSLVWPDVYGTVSNLSATQYPPTSLTDLLSLNPLVTSTFTSPITGRPGVLRWDIGNVQTSAVQTFLNSPAITFTPQTTGTFYVDVTGRNYKGSLFYIHGASSPNRDAKYNVISQDAYSSLITLSSAQTKTYTLQPFITSVTFAIVGGGGGGGSATESRPNIGNGGAGGGGGSGGVVTSQVIPVNPGSKIIVSVGSGGAPSNSTNPGETSNGGKGGDTIVSFVSSNGVTYASYVAGGGLGGGGGWPYHGGAGGAGGFPNGNSGKQGYGEWDHSLPGGHDDPGGSHVDQLGGNNGGAGGASVYKGAGAGGDGPGSYDVAPGFWNGDRGGDGLAEITFNYQAIHVSAPSLTGTFIPDLTAIPEFSNGIADIPIYAPTGGFLIEQPLQGWSYSYNNIQISPFDRDLGAKPYWATIYSDKDENTRSKSVYTAGYPNVWMDGYLPHHIPRISPLKLQYGSILEYERNGSSFWWTQPLVFKPFIGRSIWSMLNFGTNTSNLSSIFETENIPSLTAFATTSASDIILTNNIDGTPVTVMYYALSSFVWSISTVSISAQSAPGAELYFQAQLPYANISNRFYPTIATIPTLEYLYTQSDVGGYFLPQNLGASQFINKDFTVIAPVSSALSAKYVVEDSSIHVGGRGLTKEDQNTIYDWTENNLWMKESSTTGELAGYVKKGLTKQLQTFIPYQSNNSELSIGLVTPQSRITPWGGPYNSQWTDKSNEPKGFTGVRNVSAWSDLQVLKQNGKVADNWVTDVYGNQYGLFKQLSGLSITDRLSASGELWVRTNKQVTVPGYIALSSIFSQVPSTFYAQVTSTLALANNPQEYLKNLYGELASSVIHIDCFFDVLLIQTTTSVIFAKLMYDYETDQITTTFDNMRGYFGFPDYALLYKTNPLSWFGETLTFEQHTF